MELRNLFSQLGDPNSKTRSCGADIDFVAQPIPGVPRHRLAIDATGAPALLLRSADEGDLAPIALEHVTVQHGVHCRVRTPEALEEETFSVISCRSAEKALHEYFLCVCESLLDALGPMPSRTQIASMISSLAELFHAMSEPPRKLVQGLWAELFMIAHAADPLQLLQCWHAHPEDRYDFSSGAERLEIKSAITGIRQHRFSLDQIRPAASIRVIVASMFIERNARGVSLRGLADQIRGKIRSNSKETFHLERMIALILGKNWRDMDIAFDLVVAGDSLRFYRAEDIPSVDPKVPAGVCDVHFRVDLSACVPLERSGMAEYALLRYARSAAASSSR